jgi:hypothetical protein
MHAEPAQAAITPPVANILDGLAEVACSCA